MDALRVSAFSRDDKTPIRSVHFRGEPGKSWIAAYCLPIAARTVPLTEAVMAGQPVVFSAAGSLGSIREYRWDFGDGVQTSGRQYKHVFAEPGVYRVVLTVTDGTYKDACPALVRVHTEPIPIDASEAILAVAGGASLDNPVWIVPVGPGTNPASAILQARREGFELKGRIRIMWLGDHQ